MVRYRLIEFFNKYSKLVSGLFVLIFTLYTGYIFCLGYDLFNIVYSCSVNCELIKSDDDIIDVDEFELDNSTLTLNGGTYEDVNITFYGIGTDDNTTYFSNESNTLLQSLPENFWVSFLLSTNAFVVLFTLVVLSGALYFIYKGDVDLVLIKEKRPHRFFIVLTIILSIICVFSLLLLY